jgi:hypothetical protein
MEGLKERAFFFNLGIRTEWVVKATPLPFYPGNDHVPMI